MFGRLDQTTASFTTRLTYIFMPDLTFQLYAQPFFSADYDDAAGFAYRVNNPDFNIRQLNANAVLR